MMFWKKAISFELVGTDSYIKLYVFDVCGRVLEKIKCKIPLEALEQFLDDFLSRNQGNHNSSTDTSRGASDKSEFISSAKRLMISNKFDQSMEYNQARSEDPNDK